MYIKSKIHDYEVIYDSIENIKVNDGDFFIIDDTFMCDEMLSKIIDKHPDTKFFWTHVEATEESKEFSRLASTIEEIIRYGFTKNNKLIAIGGGVIQDITGFIASILYRGVDWVFYPTTLLAQGDSCIGGKTSINFSEYKNQLGTFYPPIKVVIDIDFLKTLPENQIASGYGEMCHYFLIDGEESFKFFNDNLFKFENIGKVIEKSLEIKKDVIERDEFDNKDIRIVFNYGHSFGHAIETLTNYEIPHGIAVAMGMDMANYVSYKLGRMRWETYFDIHQTIVKIYGDYRLNVDFLSINDKFMSILKRDKKNIHNELGLILMTEIGYPALTYHKSDKIKDLLFDYIL